MKKTIALFTALCLTGAAQLSSASYDNNSFQRKSREYSAMAQTAYDEGDYDAAITYANEAEKNAQLSEEYIRKMLLRAEAEAEMNRARTRLAWAREIKADVYYASAYQTAADYVDRGGKRFNEEDFETAKKYAGLALEALAGVRETVPLPAQYRVENWVPARDCFWTIAGKEAVYADPYQWKKLYEANKDRIPDSGNPDLIMPGTVSEIPSIQGEYREGLYNPDADYGSIRDR